MLEDETGRVNTAGGVLRRVLVMQLVLVGGVTLGYAGLAGFTQAQAAAYGGAIALAATGLLMWQAGRIHRVAGLDTGHNMRFLYRSWLERLVLITAFFAIGIVLLRLQVPAMIAGFITGQAAVVIEGLSTGKVKKHG